LLEKKWLQHAAVADQWKLKTTKKNQFGNQKINTKLEGFRRQKSMCKPIYKSICKSFFSI